MTPLLKVDDLNAWYGKSHILRGVSFDLPQGELLALLGRNGVGKTTTMRAIMGLNSQTQGTVQLEGKDLAGLDPHTRTRSGVSLVPEHRGIFASLTVVENLRIAETSGSKWTTEQILGYFPSLAKRLKTPGGSLSGGEQQMLAIGRALLSGPKVLLLDEPTEGLAPVIVDRVVDLLETLKASGLTILLVEQSLAVCRHLADRFAIIDQGQVVWCGDRGELDESEEVLSKHLTLEHA